MERDALGEAVVAIDGELALVERVAGDYGGVIDRVVVSSAHELGVDLDELLAL